MVVLLLKRQVNKSKMADKLKVRNERNKTKPGFVVKESKFSSGVKSRWRFPRGKHSKVRQMHKGRPALPSVGYGSPKEVKGLHKSGLEMVVVKNKDEMEKINTEKQGVIIASTVGNKKRTELLKLAKEKSITILNVKDIDSSLESISKEFEERKKVKKEKLVQMSKKEEEKIKKAEENHNQHLAKQAYLYAFV